MSEPTEESGLSEAASTTKKARPRWADWRVWLGIAITVVCFWYVADGVPMDEVMAAFGRADLWTLLALSVPAHVLSIYLRALRWRHLTNPIVPMTRGTLYKAQSIGFLVNNLVPLRMGEFVRAWYLGRETGTRGAAILGTVVLERVIDIVCVLLMAGASVALLGSSAGDGILAQGAILLLPVAFVPLAGLIALRFAPDLVIGIVEFMARPLPDRLSGFLVANLRRFTEGLGALSGGTHLVWIFVHSVLIWGVVGTVPVTAGLMAFDIEVESFSRLLLVSWLLLAAIGAAVAIPSAPGFFGVYQLAFVAVLTPIGVDKPTCLALGLLVWFVFWCSFTFQGLIVLRAGGISFAELAAASSKDPRTNRR